MNPDHFVSVARSLAKSSNRPNRVFLRRGVSSCYYAMFHELCNLCADALVGGGASRRKNEWRHTYRALNHGEIKKRFNQIQSDKTYFNLPKVAADFGQKFVDLQLLRHKADYDPSYRLNKDELEENIEKVEDALRSLRGINTSEKKALAAYILFEKR